MKRILVAPNSFKGCALSPEIAAIIVEVLKKNLPAEKYKIVPIPLTDGGDGFLEVLLSLNHGKKFTLPHNEGCNSLNREFIVGIANNKIILESAYLIGLQNNTPSLNQPLYTSSKTLGCAILKAVEYFKKENISEILIGVGGTATVDMGIGMLSVFGLKLLDNHGNELEAIPANFNKTVKVIPPALKINQKIKFVIDCNNPLLGSNGGVRVYGPQKGLNTEGISVIEEGFQHILDIIGVENQESLSGAGGGLASVVSHFYPVELIETQSFIKEELLGEHNPEDFNLLITGEGKADEQTFMNKAPGVVTEMCGDSNCEVFMLCGINELEPESIKNISIIEISKYFDNLEDSIRNYEEGIRMGVSEITAKILKTI